MYQLRASKEAVFRGVLFLMLVVLALTSCGIKPPLGDFATHTPSPSLTPTCAPDINLTTPEGWDPTSRLIIVLFDPNSNNGEYLEFTNGEKTQSITEFVIRVIPEVAKPGDQISVFRLGYRKYENARFLRNYSYSETPQLYNTPSPHETLTPLPVVTMTNDGGLIPIQATSFAKTAQTAHAFTSTALSANDDCKRQIWNESAMFTATFWAHTQAAEIATIKANVVNAATPRDILLEETPYAPDVVYEGLGHASVDLKSECHKYDKCILIIIDDLNTWTVTNQGTFDIDLDGIDLVYSIMPNCKDINQPSCKTLQEFWSKELVNYNSGPVIYYNGVHAEKNLLNTIGR